MKILPPVRLIFSFLLIALTWHPLSAKAPPLPPPLGQLIDLGGRRLHLNCTGSGSPTVIAEDGSGAFSIDWALVQTEVSRFTRFCSYDRAGYGWSDAGPTRDTVEETADDLHLLLQTAGIRPPYILLGASLGGMYIRAYQRRYPDQIVGLVFDDATTEGGVFFPVNGKNTLILDISANQLHDLFVPLLRNPPPPPPPLPDSIEPPFDRLPKELQAAHLWAIRKFISDSDISQGLPSAESWREEFVAQRRERLQRAHPLGSLPVIVLARTQDTDGDQMKQAAELTALSSAGKLVMADKSGHEIHLYRPDLVIQSLHEVLVWTGQRATADPSIPLRSTRDDKLSAALPSR